jgi:6-phospho-3-hexuloisomerase
MNFEESKDRFIKTIYEINKFLLKNSEIIDYEKIFQLLDLLVNHYTNNKMIFLYGAGRSGFIARCFAQRLMHLGFKSCYISDTITYRYKKDDIILIISGSGETPTSVTIARTAKEIGGKIVVFTANPLSSISKIADLIIQIEGKSKDRAISKDTLAPYTSLFDISTLAILDTIGGIIMKRLGVSESEIDKRHASVE